MHLYTYMTYRLTSAFTFGTITTACLLVHCTDFNVFKATITWEAEFKG